MSQADNAPSTPQTSAETAEGKPWFAIAVCLIAFAVFSIFAIVPKLLHKDLLSPDNYAGPKNAETRSNIDYTSWVARSFFRRAHLCASTIHPDSTLGRKLAENFPGDYQAIALSINNIKGQSPLAVDLGNARVYDFSGRSFPVTHGRDLAKTEQAQKWAKESPLSFTVEAGAGKDKFRTALLFIPRHADPASFYSLELAVNESAGSGKMIELVVEGRIFTRDEKIKDYAKDVDCLFSDSELEPVLRRATSADNPLDQPPLYLKQPGQ